MKRLSRWALTRIWLAERGALAGLLIAAVVSASFIGALLIPLSTPEAVVGNSERLGLIETNTGSYPLAHRYGQWRPAADQLTARHLVRSWRSTSSAKRASTLGDCLAARLPTL
jgi:hypothetical protein